MIKSNIAIENARIGFRNFSGKEGAFNPPGRRNFCVFLDQDLARTLESDGWNIRWLQPKDDQEDPQAYLQVTVSYNNMPPKVIMITGRGRTILDEEAINVLDWADIKEVDLIINPYNWKLHAGTANEKSGVKAYLKAMYVTISEDEFESKYYNVPNADENVGD